MLSFGRYGNGTFIYCEAFLQKCEKLFIAVGIGVREKSVIIKDFKLVCSEKYREEKIEFLITRIIGLGFASSLPYPDGGSGSVMSVCDIKALNILKSGYDSLNILFVVNHPYGIFNISL